MYLCSQRPCGQVPPSFNSPLDNSNTGVIQRENADGWKMETPDKYDAVLVGKVDFSLSISL